MKPRRFASATMASIVTAGAVESTDIRREAYPAHPAWSIPRSRSGKAEKRKSGKAEKRKSGKAEKRKSGKAEKRKSGEIGETGKGNVGGQRDGEAETRRRRREPPALSCSSTRRLFA